MTETLKDRLNSIFKFREQETSLKITFSLPLEEREFCTDSKMKG